MFTYLFIYIPPFQEQLIVTANGIINQLLTAYNIAKLFLIVDDLKPSVNNLLADTAYIRANHESVKKMLSSYSGELSAYTDLLVRAFRDLCNQLRGSVQYNTCLQQLSNAEQLRFTFDPTKVNANPSITLQVMVEQFNFNLTAILTPFDSARVGIDRITEEAVQKLCNFCTINVNSYIRPTRIHTKRIEDNRISMWLIEVRVLGLLDRTHIRLRPISVVSGVLSLFALFTLIVSVAVVLSMMLVQSEGCRNFTGQTSQSLTDTILYRYMRHEWSNWLNNATISPDILSLLNIGPPTNLTKVISTSCNPNVNSPNQVGLFGLVGHERNLNFQPLLTSDKVTSIITEAENEFVTQIVQTDFASYIPKDLDSLHDLARNESYTELSRNMLSVPNLTTFVDTTAGFLHVIPDSVYVQTVNKTLQLIKQSTTTLEQVQMQSGLLAEAFLNLTKNQDLTNQFDALFESVKTTASIVSNKTQLEAPIRPAFQTSINQFLEEMNKLLLSHVDRYLDVLIPCGRLYKMYHLVFKLVCKPDGLCNAMGVFSMLLVITILLLIIDLFLFVRFNARHQVQSHLVENHLNWSKAVKWTYEEWTKQIHRA
ncbi:unnamed protein product [Echinostoma caproni]|uniref:Prominin n=1 Tax=Echinostoma caproni TaxID=27848 RepID=A0A183AP76_9TREM|nr:unnamed protein product [Echinostoma caproni]